MPQADLGPGVEVRRGWKERVGQSEDAIVRASLELAARADTNAEANLAALALARGARACRVQPQLEPPPRERGSEDGSVGVSEDARKRPRIDGPSRPPASAALAPGTGAPVSATASQAPAGGASGELHVGQAVPGHPGWVVQWSRSSARQYFYHSASNRSLWHLHELPPPNPPGH